ncbi:helix-turn-helix transcriptional regulator [Streptomyces sp. MA5143a]|uniref:helix-turn-helix transcriptional regulator n=1 Tax=Streptomyces sp. MA5143a TaxID=2083010 RepID=UPI000D275009|nr:LuxR family transcriptional regulator [Streptomyces sp. MA5143a]SPF04009.1 transcriptional regulator MalT [Streptomyces sp. MA5143a]
MWNKAAIAAFKGVSACKEESAHGSGLSNVLQARVARSGLLGSLIERTDAVAELNRLLADAEAGHSRLAVIQGARGTGKSRLVHDYLDAVSGPGVRTVAMTALPDDAEVPFGVLRQVGVGTPLPTPLCDRREAWPEEEAAADAHRVAREITALAEHEVLVISVDDIHYVDPESLDYIVHVMSRLRSARVLGIVTHDAGRGPAVQRLLPLYRTPGLGHITLHPLSLDGVARLAARHLGDTTAYPHTAELFLRSGGNPLVLQSLLLGRGEAEGDTVSIPGGGREAATHGDRVAAPQDESLPASEAAALHVRMAECMFEGGAPARCIAKHLLSAAWSDAPWAVANLRAAARDAVREGHLSQALRYLDLALGGTTDARERAALRATAARLEWCHSPASAARHLAAQQADFFAGHLGNTEVSDLVWRLAWYGQVDDAVAVLAALPGTHPQHRDLADWLGAVYPEHAVSIEAPPPPTPRSDGEETGDPCLALAADLVRILATGPDRQAASAAELALQTGCLDADSVWSGVVAQTAVVVLIQADRLDTAQAWCDKLLGDTALDGTGLTWRAVFTALRGEVALLRGDLTTAHDDARRALDLVPPQGWGATIGQPLGCAVRAAIRLGRIGDADAYMKTGVPDAMLQSRYGLCYLYARGEHRLATGRGHAALADFRACEALPTRLGPGLTGRVPWQLGAAAAWLQQGDRKEARLLLRPLLDRHTLSGRDRGAALRLLGRATRPERGVHLLAQAVETLEDYGDKYELAAALANLSEVHERLGNQRAARDTARRAWLFAREAGALWLCRLMIPEGAPPEPSPGRAAALTEQERRVAALAAVGSTNREISERLHITASTVEQHLTRVYRKLDVSGRRELPPWLAADNGAGPR